MCAFSTEELAAHSFQIVMPAFHKTLVKISYDKHVAEPDEYARVSELMATSQSPLALLRGAALSAGNIMQVWILCFSNVRVVPCSWHVSSICIYIYVYTICLSSSKETHTSYRSLRASQEWSIPAFAVTCKNANLAFKFCYSLQLLAFYCRQHRLWQHQAC